MRKRATTALTALGVGLACLTVPTATASAAPAGDYDQFIVTFADNAASKEVRAAGVSRLRETATGAVVVRADRGLDRAGAAKLMAQLRKQAGVVDVEPDLLMTAQSTPNDARYAEQWALFEPQAGMNLPTAWDTADGAGVTVAVLDTGITAHSDLAGNVVAGYDFVSDAAAARDGNGRDADPADQGDWYLAGECGSATPGNSSWHGTHVAGSIAAVTGNGAGVAGVAPGAKIQPVRVLAKCGGRTSDIADAITWASGGRVSRVPNNANPADVINLSLGGLAPCSRTYQRAIDGAVSRGTTVVVAAGNSNRDVADFTPANCAGVITVAASDREGNRSFYSNFGAGIDLTAPGGEVRDETDPPGSRTKPQDGVLSTLNAGTTAPGAESYQTYMGTSMAAPHVAGIAALLLGEQALTPAQVEATLKATTRPLPGACAGGCGTGLVDAAAAVAAL